jgi:hypothetical protein
MATIASAPSKIRYQVPSRKVTLQRVEHDHTDDWTFDRADPADDDDKNQVSAPIEHRKRSVRRDTRLLANRLVNRPSRSRPRPARKRRAWCGSYRRPALSAVASESRMAKAQGRRAIATPNRPATALWLPAQARSTIRQSVLWRAVGDEKMRSMFCCMKSTSSAASIPREMSCDTASLAFTGSLSMS